MFVILPALAGAAAAALLTAARGALKKSRSTPAVPVKLAEVIKFTPQPAPVAAPVGRTSFAPGEPAPSPAPAPPGKSNLVSVLRTGLGAIQSGNVVAGGLAVSELEGRFVEDVLGLGDGQGDVARLVGVSGLPVFIAEAGVDKALDVLGLEGEQLHRDAKQAVATGILVPGLLPTLAIVKGADALLDAALPGLHDAIHQGLRQFDITDQSTPAGKLVKTGGAIVETIFGGDGLGGAVKDVGGLFGSIFNGGSDEAPAVLTALSPEEQLRRSTLARESLEIHDRAGGYKGRQQYEELEGEAL